MATIPTPHHPWCGESDCYTRQDGLLVHLGAETLFDADRGMVGVRLVDRGDGPEVKVTVDGLLVTTSATLYPELAVDLADSLVRHADCAQGPLRAP